MVEEEHLGITIENVLFGIDKFNFPIDFMTLGMEEDRKVSSIGGPSISTSQVWIDVEHGEMTLQVGEKKVKFNLHQSIPITDEQKMICMMIKSSLPPFEELTPTLLQEDTLKDLNLRLNLFPPKSWHLSSYRTIQRWR